MQAINFLENSKVIKSLLLAIFGSVLLTISAKLQTPFTLVPATMQTFVVLLIGMILGPRLAATTVILYLFQGSIGIPVFAMVDTNSNPNIVHSLFLQHIFLVL